MAARLSRLIGLAVLVLPAAAVGQSPGRQGETRAGSQVITGETLRRAGAMRLSDVLTIATGWDVETVDGLTWSASPLGGSPFGASRWNVLVDGRPVDDDLFGRASLDRLGVPLEQVAEVELIQLPRLEAGVLTTGGVIHIRTTDPAVGPSTGGRFTTGSEIGDPGPFAFTPQATSNVDRLGHSAAADLAYGASRWFASAAIVWSRLVPTDPAIVDRYLAALGPIPRLRSTSPSLRLGALLGGGRHEVVFRQSHVHGVLALSPFGTEMATDERFTVIGIAGDLPVRRGAGLTYDLSHSINRARRAPGRPGPALDWAARTSEARAELARPGAILELAGLRLRQRAVDAPARLDALSLVTAYLRVRPRVGAPGLSGSITLGEGEVGVGALVTQRWDVAPNASLEGMLSYQRTSRAEDNTIWAWTERGYRLLEESGADFDVLGAPESPERLGLDLGLVSRPVKGLALTARALLRRSRGLSLERRELHFLPAITSFEGPTALVRGAGGELAGGSMELAAHTARGLDLRASYWARATVGGDRAYRDAWAAVPRHGARATVEYAPVAGLDLWASAAYRGTARRVELSAVEAESDGRYRERLDRAVTLDVAIQKRLWDGRLRAHFGIRNLLGAELRYHPAGATFGPTATVQLEADLP